MNMIIKISRIKADMILCIKVFFVNPNPFNILPRVEDININGHSQASIVMNSPASGELKKKLPMSLPNMIKKAEHRIPNMVQYFKVFEVSRDTRS